MSDPRGFSSYLEGHSPYADGHFGDERHRYAITWPDKLVNGSMAVLVYRWTTSRKAGGMEGVRCVQPGRRVVGSEGLSIILTLQPNFLNRVTSCVDL